MTKPTISWLQQTITAMESQRDEAPFGISDDHDMTLEAFKLALAGMEAEPVAALPVDLHPDTKKLVADFCMALAEKLYNAQLKYGYDADWKQDGWPTQCQAHFHQHIAKGDPRDVAAYCAFMWYHGWKTSAMQDSEANESGYRAIVERISEIVHGKVTDIDLLSVTVKSMKDKLSAAPQPLTTSERSELENYRNAQQVVPSITKHFDDIALETAREIMCDVNRRHEFLGGDVQLLSRIQCRVDDACRAAMLQGKAEPAKTGLTLREGLAAIRISGIAIDAEKILAERDALNEPTCWCRTCRPVTVTDMRFVVCPQCGNKRCPHANDCRNACTGSNEPGQEGSAYPAAPQQESE